MNKIQKVIWTVYLFFWFYIFFFIDYYYREDYIFGYLFFGWIPFLIAHFVWKDKRRKDESVPEENKVSFLKKIKTSLRLGWWNESYTGERLMRESRALLIYLTFANLIYALVEFSPILTQEEKEMGIVSFFIGGLFLAAAILKSFWFRFICILLWVINLFLSIFIGPNEFTVLFVVIFLYGIFFLNKMWKHRKEKIIQPPFNFKDLTPIGQVDMKEVGRLLIRVFAIAGLLAIIIKLISLTI